MASIAPHELVRIIGEEATIRLLVRLGGVEVYVPRHPTETSEVANVIGLPAAARLGAAIGPARVALPKARHWCRQRALARVRAGLTSARQAALMLDLTERHVRHLLARAESRARASG